MREIPVFTLLISLCCLLGCAENKGNTKNRILVDLGMLDSIRKASDTSYEKPYRRQDFVTAAYFISKKDSTVTQIMKDSLGLIRQVIIEKNERRTYVAEFYPNGQLISKVMLDEFGHNNGPAEEFYETGVLKRTGNYTHGMRTGKWKNFDEKGKYEATDEYNENGQQVKTYVE